MKEKNRRARTGCLTCRARHVKCDERRPTCRRCSAANVECAGFEKQRVLVTSQATRSNKYSSSTSLLSDQEPSTSPSLTRSDSERPTQISHTIQRRRPSFADRIPNSSLVAFPSSPRLHQSPCHGARHVLGFNQALLRTVPLLFPQEELVFWRDELFQHAWGCEYLYLTIVALGNIHRVALTAASEGEEQRARNLELKITAVHLYTDALKGLASDLNQAKTNSSIVVATLCLMAYFESFSGNIPAFIGRVQSAHHYYRHLITPYKDGRNQTLEQEAGVEPFGRCIRSLKWTCNFTVPLRYVHSPVEDTTRQPRRQSRASRSKHSATIKTPNMLQGLIDLVSGDPDMDDLIWSTVTPYARTNTAEAIRQFQAKLRGWRSENLSLVPELNTDSALETLLTYKWQRFSFPPPAYTTTSQLGSLAAAHYNFYAARMKWALLLLGDDVEYNQLAADFYFYEALRHAASHLPRLSPVEVEDGAYIPCEALNVGLLPLLHQTALCSPQPVWLQWIKGLCEQIGQEGVVKGLAYAKHLDCLHRLQVSRGSSSQPTMESYPSPWRRAVGVLIPEADGQHFISYFAAPELDVDSQSDGLDIYRVVGSARWKCNHGESPLEPQVDIYDESHGKLEFFSVDWLYGTRPSQEWLSWSRSRQEDFHMDRALEDHISGTRLLLASNETLGSSEEMAWK